MRLDSLHRNPPETPFTTANVSLWVLLLHLLGSMWVGRHFLRCSESRYRGFGIYYYYSAPGGCFLVGPQILVLNIGVFDLGFAFSFHNTTLPFPLFLFLMILGWILIPILPLFRIPRIESSCFEFSDYYLRAFFLRQPVAVEFPIL